MFGNAFKGMIVNICYKFVHLSGPFIVLLSSDKQRWQNLNDCTHDPRFWTTHSLVKHKHTFLKTHQTSNILPQNDKHFNDEMLGHIVDELTCWQMQRYKRIKRQNAGTLATYNEYFLHYKEHLHFPSFSMNSFCFYAAWWWVFRLQQWSLADIQIPLTWSKHTRFNMKLF